MRRAAWLRRAEVAVVGALTLAGLAIRLHALDAQPLWSDEGLSLHRAALGWAELVRGRIVVDGTPTTDPMPPLYFALLAAARPWLGDGIWPLRFVGAALAAAAVPLAWVAARRLLGRGSGVAAALWVALAPFGVWYAQELRPYGLVLTATQAMTALAAAPVGEARAARGRGARWLFVSILAGALHPFALFVAAAQAPFVWPAAWRASGTAARRAIALAVVLAATAIAPRAIAVLAGAPQVDFAALAPTTVVRQALAAFAVGISPSLSHPWGRVAPLAALALLGLAAGAVDARRRRGVAMAAAMAVAPVVAVIALSAINPIYNGPRHVLPALPGFLLLAAAAATLPAAIRRRGAAADWPRLAQAGALGAAVAAASATAAGVIVAGTQLGRQVGGSPYVKDDHRSLVLDLAERAREGDQFVVHDAIIALTLEAEARALGVAWPWQAIPHFPSEAEDAAVARLAALRPAQGGRIWFVDKPVPRGGFAPTPIVEAADRRWTLLDRRQYDRMWLEVGLRVYDRPGRTPIGSAVPLTAALAAWHNGLALNDVVRETDGAVAAGSSLRLAADWQRHAPVGGDAAFALRLVGRDGAVVDLGGDRVLPGRPVDDLPLGAVAAAPLDAVVPVDTPPGEYAVELRLVDVGQGAPAPIDAGGVDAPWRAVVTATVGPSRLAPHAVRRLQQRRSGWRAAPPVWAGGWRLVATSAVPATYAPGGPMALNVTWQWDPPPAWPWAGGTAGATADVDERAEVAGRQGATVPPRDAPHRSAALRLVDGRGREVAQATAPLRAPATLGGLTTAGVTLAVPASARGRLRLQTGLVVDGGDGSPVPLARRGRWLPRRSAWTTLGRLDADAAAAPVVLAPSGAAAPCPARRTCGGRTLSRPAPSTTLALPPLAPPPRRSPIEDS